MLQMAEFWVAVAFVAFVLVLLYYRVPPALYQQSLTVVEDRAAVVVIRGDMGQSRENIEMGQGRGNFHQLRQRLGNRTQDLFEKISFQFLDALLGVKNLGLHVFQFRRDKAFAVCNGLLADIIRRDF